MENRRFSYATPAEPNRKEPPPDLCLLNFCGCFGAARGLSARETEVPTLGARGLATKEIGARLQISNKTVAEYWARICRKCNVASPAQVLADILKEALSSQ